MSKGNLSKLSQALLEVARDCGSRATKTDLENLATKVDNLAVSGGGLTESEVNELIKTQINNLIDGATETLDTLKEIADALENNSDAMTAINESIGKRYTKDEVNTLLEGKADTTDLAVDKTIWDQIELLAGQYEKEAEGGE